MPDTSPEKGDRVLYVPARPEGPAGFIKRYQATVLAAVGELLDLEVRNDADVPVSPDLSARVVTRHAVKRGDPEDAHKPGAEFWHHERPKPGPLPSQPAAYPQGAPAAPLSNGGPYEPDLDDPDLDPPAVDPEMQAPEHG
jgi:hypothetical protein